MPSRGDRPNVLFIMDDQHRYDYLGCVGAEFLQTPNLDRLARSGVRFSHCITNSPVCAPARIGLATGLQPCHVGALDNRAFLPLSVPTYYQRLRDHGYRVGCIGKLDLAKPDHYNGRHGDRPWVYSWGFTHPEECEGKMHAGGSAEPRGPYNFYLQQKGLLQKFHRDYVERARKGWTVGASWDSVLPTEDFEDVYIGRRAAEWIENVPDDFPWHYFVSFVGPHDPFDPPAEYADLYREAEVPDPIQDDMEDKPDWVRGRAGAAEPAGIRQTRRQYCGSIAAIDDQVGRMLDALDRRGMMDNTYIVFTSDHGEMLGDHGLYAKSVAYEAALRVPLIVAGPDIPAEKTSDALVELIDLNPTVCELAGLPPQEGIDARSLVPLLQGEHQEHRAEAVSCIRNFRCIRTARYKLIDNHGGPDELYDLEEDPCELNNVAAAHPRIVRDLRARMNRCYLEAGPLR